MLNRAVKRLTTGIQTVVGVLFLVLFGLNIVRIALRYFIGASWLWVPDLSRLLFVWIVFLGASVVVARGDHLIMDFFLHRMGPATFKAVSVLIHSAELAFFAIMIVMGAQITAVRMGIPFDTWDLPTGWAYLAVPVCGALMSLFNVNAILKLLGSKENEGEQGT